MKDEYSKYKITLKIVLLGDHTGKTSIINTYSENGYSIDNLSTLGVECISKNIQFDKYEVKLEIWDTPGQERYRSIIAKYYREYYGFVFICDITNRSSFQSMINFVEAVNEEVNNYIGIICANKCDLEEERNITKEELISFGLSRNMEVFEVSAKTGKNVNEAFNKLVELMIRKKTKEPEILKYMKNEKLLYNLRINLISSKNSSSQFDMLNIYSNNVGYLLGSKILEFNKYKIGLIIYNKDIKRNDVFSNQMK